MDVKIAKDYQTRITSYKLDLTCECGGKMFYTSCDSRKDKEEMIVECNKCGKKSTVVLSFNQYGTIGE